MCKFKRYKQNNFDVFFELQFNNTEKWCVYFDVVCKELGFTRKVEM